MMMILNGLDDNTGPDGDDGAQDSMWVSIRVCWEWRSWWKWLVFQGCFLLFVPRLETESSFTDTRSTVLVQGGMDKVFLCRHLCSN